jgi:hypothetical protein
LKLLWKAPEDSIAQLLIIELEKAGIAATMHHDRFPITHMLTPESFPQTEVLVLKEDYEAAREVLALFLEMTKAAESEAPPEDWQCPKCGEIVYGNFSVCWNCGASDIDEPEESPDPE